MLKVFLSLFQMFIIKHDLFWISVLAIVFFSPKVAASQNLRRCELNLNIRYDKGYVHISPHTVGYIPLDLTTQFQIFIKLSDLLYRRFFNALLQSSNLLTSCTLSSLITTEAGGLFCQLVTMLKFYATFEIDDVTGEPLTHGQVGYAKMHV